LRSFRRYLSGEFVQFLGEPKWLPLEHAYPGEDQMTILSVSHGPGIIQVQKMHGALALI
jgi:hypothetical protein